MGRNVPRFGELILFAICPLSVVQYLALMLKAKLFLEENNG